MLEGLERISVASSLAIALWLARIVMDRLLVLALFGSAAAFSPGLSVQQPQSRPRSAARAASAPLLPLTAASLQSVGRSLGPTMVAKPLKIGVVGVTGAVGKEIIDVLGTRNFPVSDLKLFASKRSAGKPMATPFGTYNIEEFSLAAARECDVVFLAVSGEFALEYAPQITADGGPLVIDNSSAFRYDADVPLVIPEINAEAARKSKKRLVANPNCTTAIALMALAPLHKEFGLKKVIMSTYQAASGAGQEGMDELAAGCAKMAGGGDIEGDNKHFAHPLPFNVIPHIDKFLDDDYTKEERKVHRPSPPALRHPTPTPPRPRRSRARAPNTDQRTRNSPRPARR